MPAASVPVRVEKTMKNEKKKKKRGKEKQLYKC